MVCFKNTEKYKIKTSFINGKERKGVKILRTRLLSWMLKIELTEWRLKISSFAFKVFRIQTHLSKDSSVIYEAFFMDCWVFL